MFAVLFALWATMLTIAEMDRINHGVEASATVVDKRHQGRHDYATVVFTTQAGKRVRTEVIDVRWGGDLPSRGEVVQVRYRPSHPGDASGAGRSLLDRPFVIMLWLASAGFAIWSYFSRGLTALPPRSG